MLFKEIWLEENVPEDWRRGLIIKYRRKVIWRTPTTGEDYTFTSCKLSFSQCYSSTYFTSFWGEEYHWRWASWFQTWKELYRPDFHLFVIFIINIIEQSQEWQLPLYVNFIDFSKAFDSVHIDSLWNILEYYGKPPKLFRLVKMFYGDYRCAVR